MNTRPITTRPQALTQNMADKIAITHEHRQNQNTALVDHGRQLTGGVRAAGKHRMANGGKSPHAFKHASMAGQRSRRPGSGRRAVPDQQNPNGRNRVGFSDWCRWRA